MRWNMTRTTMNTFTLPSSAPQVGWCFPCAAHLWPTIRRKTTKVNARLPVSSNLDNRNDIKSAFLLCSLKGEILLKTPPGFGSVTADGKKEI